MIRFLKILICLGMQIEVFTDKVKWCLGFTLQYKKKVCVHVYMCVHQCVCQRVCVCGGGHETMLSVS